MYADSKKIEWLLFESGQSIVGIHKKSGIAMTTVSDLVNKKSSIEQMRFRNAAKLTQLAEEISRINTKEKKIY